MEQVVVLKDVVKDNNMAKFSHAISGVLYYNVMYNEDTYQFEVNMNDKDDVGTATFPSNIRAITLMRYIRKAIDKGEFVKL